MKEKIWFTSDTHFRHANIIKHCPWRAEAGGFAPDDIEAHDRWILDRWNSTIGKKDTIYILGDFAFAPAEHVKRLLGKLNGKKFLILGNHDKSSDHDDMTLEYREEPVKGVDWPYDIPNYFVQITQMKMVTFRKSNFDFLDEDFQVFMCHYPMVTWNGKHQGCVMAHGHCHGRLDDYNRESPDLRLDVGIDSDITDFRPISLEELYGKFKEKSGGEKFIHYAANAKKEREMKI